MTASTETQDLNAILPTEGKIVVEGIPATVKRLKSREFMKLVRILTNGMGAGIGDIDLSGDEETLQGKFIALAVMAIPNAEDEFHDFIANVVVPDSKSQTDELRKALLEPELDTTIDVLTIVAAQEAADFRSLVGKLKAALKIVQTAYRPTAK